MSNIIYIPQFPSSMRYQEWHYFYYSSFFSKIFNYMDILGSSYIYNLKKIDYNKKDFSPINEAVKLETVQMNEYLSSNIEDSTLFLSDISFPGLFSNMLHFKKPEKCYAYCHGTSKNRFDIFSKYRKEKWLTELAHSKIFDKIFVGSRYHANKLKWKNTEVVGLPIPPFNTYKEEKKFDIISVARSCIQKVTKNVEYEVIKQFGKIIRKENNSWVDYYKFLSQSKILLITGKEDTFNYTILEAVINNCIPLAPNRCSYPELLPREYIYKDIHDLKEKIDYYLINYDKIPKLLNWDLICNYDKNLKDIMTS